MSCKGGGGNKDSTNKLSPSLWHPFMCLDPDQLVKMLYFLDMERGAGDLGQSVRSPGRAMSRAQSIPGRGSGCAASFRLRALVDPPKGSTRAHGFPTGTLV